MTFFSRSGETVGCLFKEEAWYSNTKIKKNMHVDIQYMLTQIHVTDVISPALNPSSFLFLFSNILSCVLSCRILEPFYLHSLLSS